MIDSPKHLEEILKSQHYVAGDAICTILYLAITLKKPLLIEGPAGVGKTQLARSLSEGLNLPYLRLQCYEGLDESKALYEWEYAKQLLYIQILRDKIGESLKQTNSIAEAVDQLAGQEDAFFSERFLLPRPLLKSLMFDTRSILLIDEIDKADPEFEAFLLEFLSEFSVTIPELGPYETQHPPIVLLTSNDQRDLSDALKRRCLHLYIGFPDLETETRIVSERIPAVQAELLQQCLEFVQKLRNLELKKVPSISESIDWVQSLLALQLKEWNHQTIENTLSILLKYQSDVEHAKKSLLQRGI